MKKNNLLNRRGYERFNARNGVMAFFNNVKLLYGQIEDISLGGVSFFYFHSEKLDYSGPLLQPDGFVDIIYGKKDYSLRKVMAHVISDDMIDPARTSKEIITNRRCSLEFKELTSDQLFLLKRFLLTCTKYKPCYQYNCDSSLPLDTRGLRNAQKDYLVG